MNTWVFMQKPFLTTDLFTADLRSDDKYHYLSWLTWPPPKKKRIWDNSKVYFLNIAAFTFEYPSPDVRVSWGPLHLVRYYQYFAKRLWKFYSIKIFSSRGPPSASARALSQSEDRWAQRSARGRRWLQQAHHNLFALRGEQTCPVAALHCIWGRYLTAPSCPFTLVLIHLLLAFSSNTSGLISFS